MGDLRYLTAGESHGPSLTVIVEGLPAGIPLRPADIEGELARRRRGYGRGARMKLERDDFDITGGVRHGRTLGSPLSVVVRNTEWTDPAKRWSSVMSIEPSEAPGRPETRPRPGHADLVGMMKYDTHDARDILERASARETAARTVAGVPAKALLSAIGARVVSHVRSIGDVVAEPPGFPTPDDFDRIESSECRCLDPRAEERMIATMDRVKDEGDTLGGVFEVLAYGVPPGLGSHVHWDRKIDGRLAQALVSIQAMKGVAFGDGFALASTPGSGAHDEIFYAADRGFYRETNRSGGIEGGTTTGEVLRVSVAVKPFSTLRKALRTVDVSTKEEAAAIVERSDVCAVPSACPIGEAVVAFTLAQAVLEKFGGDTLDEVRASHARYMDRIREF